MPRDMQRLVCTDPDTIHMIRKMAMEVFADMTAYDYPFTDAITAVFVTGMKLAQDVQEPR